ncbi:MFS transporter, partial [Bacillus vallismortis]|nr:MFS transporter [Bacillus vallismortis]
NTLRQISGSIGTSLITTIYTNRTTFHYSQIADKTSTADPNFLHAFQNAVSNLMVNMNVPYETAKTYVYTHIYKHASL